MSDFSAHSAMNVSKSNLKDAISVPQIRGVKIDAFPAFYII